MINAVSGKISIALFSMENTQAEQTTEQTERNIVDKKIPILEELRIAVENYEKEDDDFSKSDHILQDDISAYMMFGNIGRTPVSKQAFY